MDAFLILLAILIIFFSYILLSKKCQNTGKAKQAPEPTGAWPIIGHLRLIGGGDRLLYRTLGDLADKCGPVFSIRLGTRPALVVSSLEAARECFTVNDRALASRPSTAATKRMCYGDAMFGFAPYGEYWREMRKIVTLELLSSRRIEKLRSVWEPEISAKINELHGLCSSRDKAVLNLTRWFEHLTLDMTVRLVAGKRYYGVSMGSGNIEAERFQKSIAQFMHLMGIFEVSDAVPFLWWMDKYEKAMKETAKDLDSVVSGWLDEHRAGRVSGLIKDRTERDFIDVMISLEERGEFSKFPYDADTCIKSSAVMMIVGGSDTTSVTMTWVVSLLLNNRHSLKTAQEELDRVVGTDRLVNESDIKNLPYLQAIVKETLRMYPAAPLLGPREAIEDCTVSGYHVSAGTRLLINVWKIHRDPNIWSEPAQFRPERFITDHADMDLKAQNSDLIPFGWGRRSCPGASFALQVIHLTLGRLLHGFELSTPNDEPVDMIESFGLTLPKSVPVEVLVTPRLPPKAYV